jgi:hypothetical protein
MTGSQAPDSGKPIADCEHDYEYVLTALQDAKAGTPFASEPAYQCRKCGKRLSPVEYRNQQIMANVSYWLGKFYST